MDQRSRMLVPAKIRERLNIKPSDKINLEIYDDEVKIINADKIIDQMYEIFTKNQTDKIGRTVDDFISRKHEEYETEKTRSKKMASNIVSDSSALIMLFAKELGYEVVKQNIKHAIIPTINIAEVYKYYIEVQNLSEDDCKDLIKLLRN